MEYVSDHCQKTGIFIAVEELANKLNSICDQNTCLMLRITNNELINKYIEPLKKYYDKAYNFLHGHSFEMLIYSNGLSSKEPLPIPNIPGIHQDIEFLCSKLSCSKDFILELINIANYRKERYISFDLIPISLILFENFNENIYTILNCMAGIRNFNLATSGFPEPYMSFVTQIQKDERELFDEVFFNKIYNQFCYFNSREIISDIILPLTKRQIPFKSSTTLQVNENLQDWLCEYNLIVVRQKKELHDLLMKFCQKQEIRHEILQKVVSSFSIFLNQSFNCYDISDVGMYPFIFNKFSLIQISSSFYASTNFMSPELLFYTLFECVLNVLEDYSSDSPAKLFDLSHTLLLSCSSYISSVSSSLVNSLFKPFKFTYTFPSLLCFCIITYLQNYLESTELDNTQRDKLATINIDNLLKVLLDFGALIWLRRVLFENQNIVTLKTCCLIHKLFITFLLTFGNSVSSYYRALSNKTNTSEGDPEFNLHNVFLFICDFYGCSKFKKYFEQEKMIDQFYVCIDLKKMSIVIPKDTSILSKQKIHLLDFLLKLIASSSKFFMLELCAYAMYGLSNSFDSSTLISYLLNIPNMQALLSGFDRHTIVECSSYINWSNMYKMLNDLPLFVEKVVVVEMGNKMFNGCAPFAIIQLISVIFRNSPELIAEICSAKKYELINNVVKYVISDDVITLKHCLWNLLSESLNSSQICTHVISLLDQIDFRQDALRISEPVPLQSDFIKHSIICTSFFLNSKNDTYGSVYSFVKFTKRLLTNFIFTINIPMFKSSKIVKVYLNFILLEIFTNINDHHYSSVYYKWKLISKCLQIFNLIIKCFYERADSRKIVLNVFCSTPSCPLNLEEIIIQSGTDILCAFYQNGTTTKTLLEVIKLGVQAMNTVIPSFEYLSIISRSLLYCFELLLNLIMLEDRTLNIKNSSHPTILLTPISQTIANNRAINDGKPILSLFLRVLLIPNINSEIVDSISKILCVCLKFNGVEDILISRLNDSSIDSQKLLHRISCSWETSVHFRQRKTSQSISFANLLIELFDHSYFNTVECILYGSKVSESTIYGNRDTCLEYFTYHYHVSFSSILRVLYENSIIQEETSTMKMYERILTIICLCVSYEPHRVFVLPLLRTLFSYDFSYYMLSSINSNIINIRDRFTSDTRENINHLLVSFGSIINIVATDLKESLKNKEMDRVERLLNLLCYDAVNNTSFLVHLTKYMLQLSELFPTCDISKVSFIDRETIDKVANQSSHESISFLPKYILNAQPKIIDIKLFSNTLNLYRILHTKSQFYNDLTFEEEYTMLINWAREKNACEISNYSKYYLLDSILYCFSCILTTKSDSLRTLYNSDVELLSIISLILETSFTNISYSSSNLISKQFKLFSTLLSLISFESFLSISFKKLSVLCLPQNLSKMIDHLFGYQNNIAINCPYELKFDYYSSILYVNVICNKLIKYWYLNKEAKVNTDSSCLTTPFLEVNKKIISELSTERNISFIFDDIFSEDIHLQNICIELTLMLLRNNANIGEIPIIEYLFYMDFYDNLLKILKSNAQIFITIINGSKKYDNLIAKNFLLILQCFLSISNSHIGVNIIYKCNFINIVSDSDILEFPVNLLPINNKTKDNLHGFRQDAFQHVYCATLEILCNVMRLGSSLQQELIAMSAKLFHRNNRSFKSILEYILSSTNLFVDQTSFPLSRTLLSLLKQTLQFCSDLASFKNKIISQSLSPSQLTMSKLDISIFNGLNDLFDPVLSLLQRFSDPKSLLQISYLYLKDLVLQKISDFRNASFALNTFDKFDPPPFSLKTIKAIKNVFFIQFYIIRYYQQYIISYPGCDQPLLSELIFYPDKYSSTQSINKFASLNAHFNSDSTSLFRKPSVSHLFNMIESLLGWKLIIDGALKKITQAKCIKDYNVELSQLLTLHSKWDRQLSSLPNDKQQEFIHRRLNKLQLKYEKVLKFCVQLIERILMIILVHAKFYEHQFLTKLMEFHTPHLLFKNHRIDEMIQILLTKDEESRVIAEFVQQIRTFFNNDFCTNFKGSISDKIINTESFSHDVIEYLENYIIPLN